MTSTQLRQEIEESYGGTRIRLDIEVEPGQYIHLGRAVVRRVANLYAAAFDVEPDEFDLADSKRFTSLDEFIEHLQDPQNPVHVSYKSARSNYWPNRLSTPDASAAQLLRNFPIIPLRHYVVPAS